MLLFNQNSLEMHHLEHNFNTSNVTIQRRNGWKMIRFQSDFNTSNVTIQLFCCDSFFSGKKDFNTSNVTIQPHKKGVFMDEIVFQYI